MNCWIFSGCAILYVALTSEEFIIIGRRSKVEKVIFPFSPIISIKSALAWTGAVKDHDTMQQDTTFESHVGKDSIFRFIYPGKIPDHTVNFFYLPKQEVQEIELVAGHIIKISAA